jgi:Arc/MetJ-type ribon-helix-helix transcriptional regulator
MATLSIPISSEQEHFIETLIQSGKASNKAHAVRQALDWYAEEEAIQAVLEGERDCREGRVFHGNLGDILTRGT